MPRVPTDTTLADFEELASGPSKTVMNEDGEGDVESEFENEAPVAAVEDDTEAPGEFVLDDDEIDGGAPPRVGDELLDGSGGIAGAAAPGDDDLDEDDLDEDDVDLDDDDDIDDLDDADLDLDEDDELEDQEEAEERQADDEG